MLAPAIAANSGLTSIDVGYNKIGKEMALTLVSIFKEKDQMKSVGLAQCHLGIDGAKAVADYISGSSGLTALDVRRNDLGTEGKALLIAAVQGRSGFELNM